MKFSKKHDYYRGRLQSSVLDVTGKEYLVTHQEGGTRRPRSGQFIAVPSRDTKRKLGFRRNTAYRPKALGQKEGVFEHILEAILSMAQLNELIDWSVASVNGSFSPWKGGGDGVAHGFRVRTC